MTADQIAAKHGGAPITITEGQPVPLHAWCDRERAYQFASAAGVVGFMREYGAVGAAQTREAIRAR